MVSRIILLFTLCLIGSMTLPATAIPHFKAKPRESNMDNITPALSSILVLNTGGASISSAVVDSGAGYAYFGTSATPAQVFKVRLLDFTNVANLTLGAGTDAALAATTAILDPIHEIAYFGTLNGQIVKVDLSTFTEVTAVHPGLGGITAATIDPIAGFGYFGTNTGNILKMRLSDLTVNGTLTPTPSNKTITLPPSHSIDSAVIDTTNGYSYFGADGCLLNISCTPSPNIVVKVRLSDFSIVSELDEGVDDLRNAGIDTSGGYVYFGGSNLAGSRIDRFSLADLSKKQILAPAPVGAANNFVLDPSRGIGYALTGQSVAPFRLSDFNQIAEEYLQNNIYNIFNIRLGMLDPATGYGYFAASTFQSPLSQQGVILRISPSTLPSNDFSIEPDPAHIIFQEGGVGAAYITIKSNNYTGAISLSTLLSSGYALQPVVRLLQTTVTLEPNGDNYTILSISAPNQDDIPASDFAITVTASSGTKSRSISIEVTIMPGPGRFVPIINPPSLVTNPYSNYSDIALVTHTGFSGTVNFTATITPNTPNAPTVNVNPSSVIENLPKETYTDVSWVYITTNSATATGRYEVEVTATSGNETHTAPLCLLVTRHGAIQFCLISDPHSLFLGRGQTQTTLITQYMPHPPFNASMYLGTVEMTTSIVSGPSTTALQATLDPSTFPLPYILPGPQQLETTLTVTASPTAPLGNYVLRITSGNGTITGAADIPVTINASPVPSIPGVFPGDWARYEISATWNSTPLGLPPIPEIATYLGSFEATLRIGATIGNETVGLLSTASLNGTANVQEITGNTNEESGSLFPWVAGTNLSFNQTTTEEFAGSTRQVTILNITSTNGIAAVSAVWTWDLQTGILLDYQLNVQGTGNIGTINGRVHVGMIETNLWTPTLPSFTLKPEDSFLTVKQSTTTSTNIGMTSLNGFIGNISLQAQSLPNDPDLTLSISSINLGPDETVNAILTARSSTSGHFTILVNATNDGQLHYSIVDLTVTPVPPSLAIIGLSPSPLYQGQTVTLNFTATDPATNYVATWIDWGDESTPDLLLNDTSQSMCARLNPYLNNNTCAIAPSDLILAQPQDPSTIVNGSIVVFTIPQDPTFIIVHRVIGILPPSQSPNGQYNFRVRGDANPAPDCLGPNCYIPASSILAVYQRTLDPTKTTRGARYDSHLYPSLPDSLSKTYNIRINATDNNGAYSYLTTTAIVNDRPPTTAIASLIVGSTPTGATVTLRFSASDPDGTIESIKINWGDGTITNLAGTAIQTTHDYTSSGTYTISISATDNAGSTSQPSTRLVHVKPSAPNSVLPPNILGMAPVLFYGLIAAVIIALGAVTAVALGSKKTLTRRFWAVLKIC